MYILYIFSYKAWCFVLFVGFIPLHSRIDQRLLDAGYRIGQYLLHLLELKIEGLICQL